MEAPHDSRITPDTELGESDQRILFQGLRLTGPERFRARSLSRSSADWARWTGGWLAAIGGTFFLLGVLFFFASNWKEMSPGLRLGILQGGVAAAALASCLAGIRSPLGQWLLLAATVLTGVLLAVFGQVYQTGADSYEVFALWAALSLAWVILARHASLWLIWITVTQVALCLWGGQVLVPDGELPWEGVFVLVAVFNLSALAAWEIFSSRAKGAWLPGHWFRILLVTASVCWLSLCPLRWISDFFSRRGTEAWEVGTSLLWLAAVSFGVYYYQKVRLSIGSLSACLFSLGIVLVFAIARSLLDFNDDEAGTFLLIGLVSVAVFSAIATWIIRVTRAQSPSSTAPEEATDA